MGTYEYLQGDCTNSLVRAWKLCENAEGAPHTLTAQPDLDIGKKVHADVKDECCKCRSDNP